MYIIFNDRTAILVSYVLNGQLKHIVIHDISRAYISHLAPYIAVTGGLVGGYGAVIVLVDGKPYLAYALTAAQLCKVNSHFTEQPMAAELFLEIHLAEIESIVLSHLNTAITGVSAVLREDKIPVSVVVDLVFYCLIRLELVNHILYLLLTYDTGKSLVPYRAGHVRYLADVGISTYFSYHHVLF